MLKKDVLILFLSLLNPISLFASGSYYVGKDSGGVYIQTDRDGGWYVEKEDLRFFKIGETGTYSIGKDAAGTYLSTSKNQKFYLDIEARSKIVKEAEAFNAAEEKRLRDLRENENKRRQEVKDREAENKGDKQAPQPVKVEITVTSPKDDEYERSETYLFPGYYPYKRPIFNQKSKGPSRHKDRQNTRPVSPRHATGEFPWWKGSLNPRY